MPSGLIRLIRALALAGAAALSSCCEGAQCPRTCPDQDVNCINVAVLVDQSGTWNREANRDQNRDILESVAAALNNVSLDLSPITVRYHVIGENSFMRPAICPIEDFKPVLIPGACQQNKGRNTVCTIQEFRQFYEDCTELLLAAKPEMYTEITGAISNAVSAMQMSRGRYNTIVILSDLVEDRAPLPAGAPAYDLSRIDLTGFDIVLIYRVLDRDNPNPDLMNARVAEWTEKLEARGGRVAFYIDYSLTVNGLVRVLKHGVAAPPPPPMSDS